MKKALNTYTAKRADHAYWSFKPSKDGLTIDHWITDIHNLQFKPEVPVIDFRTRCEQVDKFLENRAAFDWKDYSGNTQHHKPERVYGEIWAVEFYYQGDWFRTITSDPEKVRRIYEKADSAQALDEAGNTIVVSDAKVEDITHTLSFEDAARLAVKKGHKELTKFYAYVRGITGMSAGEALNALTELRTAGLVELTPWDELLRGGRALSSSLVKFVN